MTGWSNRFSTKHHVLRKKDVYVPPGEVPVAIIDVPKILTPDIDRLGTDLSPVGGCVSHE